MPKYYTKQSSSIKLSPFVAKKLELIGREYFQVSKKKIMITDGNRTPKDQADRLYNRFKNGTRGGYENKSALKEILKVYDDGKSNKKSKTKIIEDITIQIQKQVKKNDYISKHLTNRAADIRVRYGHMPNKNQRDAFIEIAKIYGAKTALDEKKPPHIHLGF